MIESDNTPYQIKEYPSIYRRENLVFIDVKSKYPITKDIFINTNIVTNTSDKNEYEYVNLEIILESKAKNYGLLDDFIKLCKTEYDNELIDNAKVQHIFTFETIDKDSKSPEYQEYPFETTKSFSNLHFDEKAKILERVDYFIANKNEYVRLGMPYTLGILLHGLPGTGKTSFIKALAKYTERHIIILPTRKIKSIETLRSVFFSESINGVKIPNTKRLYVFEEIDCGCWKNVVMSRQLKKDDDEDISAKDMIVEVVTKLVNASDKEETCKLPEKNNITLGDFLELLDGVVEIPGRIIVMTTNQPEILDTALLRPGRIDMCVEFKKLSKNSVADIYKQWFHKDLDAHIFSSMKDFMFTQADLGNLFARKNMKEIHMMLRTGI